MQIRLSSCACIILFSVFFQGQVVTVADQDSSHTGPIKLKKTGVLMFTKEHLNGFMSGTSEWVKFVENVLCSQKCNHIFCGNILIVHVYSQCYKHILQIFFSCTLPHSLSTHLLIHTFWSDTRNSRDSALSYTGHHLEQSAMLGLSSVKPQLNVHLFSICCQLCLDPSSSVCVWINVMWVRF